MITLEKVQEFLKIVAFFGPIGLNTMLIGVLYVMNTTFTCPCTNDQNALLTVSIFIGPAFFALVAMFHILRPLRHGWFHCPRGVYDDGKPNWPKALISCLLPPVLWIFILLLDGDYVACAMTDWNGAYAANLGVSNKSWCFPTDGTRNVTELRDLTIRYIHMSQYAGYVLISVFSFLSLAVVGIHDCCISGKCDRLPNRLMMFFGRFGPAVEIGKGQDDIELSPTSSTTSHPLLDFSKQKKPGV